MDEAVFLGHTVDKLLKSLDLEAMKRMSCMWGFKRPLSKLEDVLKTIKRKLEDYTQEQQQQRGKGVNNERIRGVPPGRLGTVIYDVEDLVDVIESYAAQREMLLGGGRGGGNTVAQQVRLFFSASNQLAFLLTVVQRVDTICKIMLDLGIDCSSNSSGGSIVSTRANISKSPSGELQDDDIVAAADSGTEFVPWNTGTSGKKVDDIDVWRASKAYPGSRLHGIRVKPRKQKMRKKNEKKEERKKDEMKKEEIKKEHAKERDFVPLGRDDDRKRIIGMLLDTTTVGESVSAITIVGLGGLGKTTLAKLVYDDEKVKDHFEIRMWVHIKQLSNRRDIIRKMVKSATNKKPSESLGLDELESQLRKKIEGKIYLMVLDDAWSEDAEEWRYVKTLLSRGARGSKVLVTTRSTGVANVLGGGGIIPPYELQGLSESSSRILLETVLACQPGSESMHLLDEYGGLIISKCGGVPLTLSIVGSLLCGKGYKEWQHLLGEDFNIVDLLRTSCSQLPVHMKRCFAYFSLFPKDCEIKKHDLINLWLSQGLVEPRHSDQSMEYAGEEYFMMLLRRCFLKGDRVDDLGSVVSCKMLDATFYLAKKLAGAGSTMAYSDDSFDSSIKHVSFNFSRHSSWKIPPSLLQAQKIRTFIWVKEPEYDAKIDKSTLNLLMSKFRSLRVLDLHDFGIEKLPCSIGGLIHLRYLDLSKNDSLVKLPNSVTKLQNLQTLKLNFCQNLKQLPRGIGKLVKLRFLEIDECDSLTHMPLGLQKLTSLQVLSQFVVSKPSSKHRARGGLRVLGTLNHLKGSLKIEFIGKWTTVVHEASEANLRNKSQLIDLRINWGLTRAENVDAGNYQVLLEALQPHQNLKILFIEGYRGKDLPSWASRDKLASSLPNLVVMNIEGCKECQHLPPFGLLRSLKRLTLRYMDGVRYVESGDFSSASFYPSLEELTLHSFYNLKGWREVVGDELPPVYFPRLLKMRIWNCPKLTFMPVFHQVKCLDLWNVNHKLIEAPVIKVPTTATSSSLPSSSSFYQNPLFYLKVMQPQKLIHLKHLKIKQCIGLKSFSQLKESLGGLDSLQFLAIDGCDSLSSLRWGLQQLTSLEELEISNCGKLDFSEEDGDGMPWKSLTSLRYLTFRGIPKMATLPAGLKHVVTLKFLWISVCSGLTTLPEWVRNLTSLGHLRIEGCDTLKRLPQGLRYLQSLVKVEIMECPQLMERCREHTGEDWPYIKHARVLLHSSWRYRMLSEPGDSKRSNPQVDDGVHVANSASFSRPATRTWGDDVSFTTSCTCGRDIRNLGSGSAIDEDPSSSRKATTEIKHEGPSLLVEKPKFQPFTGKMHKLSD